MSHSVVNYPRTSIIKSVFSAFFKILFILIFLSCQCSIHRDEASSENSAKNDIKRQNSQVIKCNLKGFTKLESEHLFIEVDKPFLVRKVKGRIKSEIVTWPEDIRLLFEIRPMLGKQNVIGVKVDENGKFEIQDVKDGWYCFKTTLYGWRPIMGTINVTNRADPAEEIVLEIVMQ